MIFREITASLYPWDLYDEGVDVALDNLQNYSGVNAVYLVALMHYEKRPLTDYYYPHNPVRKVYFPEDSRIYWKLHPEFYKDSRIKPLTSTRDFLRDTDWLELLIKKGEERGLKIGVEISHTIVDKLRSKEEFPDCIQKDIFGNRLGQVLCWNNPDAKSYVLALYKDLASNYNVYMVQTCMILFVNKRLPEDWKSLRSEWGTNLINTDYDALGQLLSILLGGCFCPVCQKKAKEQGVDIEKVINTVKLFAGALHPESDLGSPETFHLRNLLKGSNVNITEIFIEYPELFDWVRFRCNSVTELFKEIYDTIKSINPSIEFRYNTYIPNSEVSGLDLKLVAPYLDSVRCSDYSEQSGSKDVLQSRKTPWLLNIRRQVGDDKKFISAIGIRPKANPELIKEGVKISAFCGADGLSLGHYDGATFANLKAIKEALEENYIIVQS
ncbi:MAG: hypothetical protein N2380_05460 [bacterium]|nr:hypothetical protein [bacterium]